MRLDLLKIVSAMVVVGVTGRLVTGEGPTRETCWVAAMHFDLLTVISTMVLERLIARSLDRGEEG
jgi:hypothetical protein